MSNNLKKTDIILIYPKTGMDIGPTIAPPHSVLSIASPLNKAGYKIKIIDQRVDPDWKINLEEEIKKKPICVGISTMTGTQIFFALEAAKIVRKISSFEIPIIWGGPHPSILPEQTLKSQYVDIVCVGEGELTFEELVNNLHVNKPLKDVKGILYKISDRVFMNEPRPLMDIETLLPVPWELINVEDYIHPDMYLKNSPRTLDIGQTSRGCPFNCGFCNSATLRQRKWRSMSIEKSLTTILEPIKKFNLTGIWIRDDEFYINTERVIKICEGIINSGLKIKWYTSGTRIDLFNKSSDELLSLLKRSGAYTLKFGAESGSNRILNLMNKGIDRESTLKSNLKAKNHNIIPAFALMIGFPTETFKEINETIDMAFELKKNNPAVQMETIAVYTALPSTPLFEIALKYGLKPPEKLENWINWNFDEYDIKGERIPWFNKKERIMIGNISYMSMLSNAIINLVEALTNKYLKFVLKKVVILVVVFYRFRLKHKLYYFAPDLLIIKFLREKIFYKDYFFIK